MVTAARHRDSLSVSGEIFVFYNQGSGTFGPPHLPPGLGCEILRQRFRWGRPGGSCRGRPKNGLRQYRALGGGAFQEVTNLTSLDFSFRAGQVPKPVYTLKPRAFGLYERSLVVTHAETNRVWSFRQTRVVR